MREKADLMKMKKFWINNTRVSTKKNSFHPTKITGFGCLEKKTNAHTHTHTHLNNVVYCKTFEFYKYFEILKFGDKIFSEKWIEKSFN